MRLYVYLCITFRQLRDSCLTISEEEYNQLLMAYTYKYPRPAVTADCIVITKEAEPKVLLIQRGDEPYKGCWAFPGGFMEIDETTEQCAIRELEEETGYKAGKLTKLGRVNPNPALFNNHVHFYLAEDLQATGKQNLDADEFINCMELSKKEVLEGMGTEQFPHAIMGMALSLYIKQNGGKI